MLFVLVFCLLPTKGDYEKINYDNEQDETIKINQTILGFSIIIFIYTFFFMIFQFCNCENCIKGFLIFKLILSFIVWALSLAVISNTNKILDSNDRYFSNYIEQLKAIKHEHIIKVILILSSNLLLNIFDFLVIICGIFDNCCQEPVIHRGATSGIIHYGSKEISNNNNNNGNIKGTIVVEVQITATVILKTNINEH